MLMEFGTPAPKKEVVVIGAGFGGLACARKLRKSSAYRVTLIDRNPYQLFSPLLYQVATASLPEDDIAFPVQQGRHVARQLVRRERGERFEAFTYRDKGQMATIGRRKAVVEVRPWLRFNGTLAWLTWLALHLAYLSGGRNRTSIFADWIWNYLVWTPRRTIVD